jgi:hypothetical protein
MTRMRPLMMVRAVKPRGWRLWSLAAVATAGTMVAMTAGVASAGARDSAYRQVNLVSDIPGAAALPDSDLVRPGRAPGAGGTLLGGRHLAQPRLYPSPAWPSSARGRLL